MRDERWQIEVGIRHERGGDLRRALEVYENLAETAKDPATAAEALRRQSTIYRHKCVWDASLRTARASAQAAIRAKLPELFSEALNAEALVYISRGDLLAAKPLLEQIISSAQDDRILGNSHQNLGGLAAQSRDFDAAKDHFSESREYFRRAGYRRGEAIALINQAAIANLTRDYEFALVAAVDSLPAAYEVGDYDLYALALINHAEALAGLDRFSEAEEHASQALGFFGIEGNEYRRVGCLRVLGDINRRQQDFPSAIRCYERALKIAEHIDARTERTMLENRLAELEAMPAAS